MAEIVLIDEPPEPVPLPPWQVAGTIVDLAVNKQARTVRIVVPENCMDAMSDEQIIEQMTFCSMLSGKLRSALPGWTIHA